MSIKTASVGYDSTSKHTKGTKMRLKWHFAQFRVTFGLPQTRLGIMNASIPSALAAPSVQTLKCVMERSGQLCISGFGVRVAGQGTSSCISGHR